MKGTDFTERTFLRFLYLAHPARGMTLTFGCFDVTCSSLSLSGFGLMAGRMFAPSCFILLLRYLFMILVVSAFLANVQMCFQGWVRSGWEGKGLYLSCKDVAAF